MVNMHISRSKTSPDWQKGKAFEGGLILAFHIMEFIPQCSSHMVHRHQELPRILLEIIGHRLYDLLW
jgi:hypothetical protein